MGAAAGAGAVEGEVGVGAGTPPCYGGPPVRPNRLPGHRPRRRGADHGGEHPEARGRGVRHRAVDAATTRRAPGTRRPGARDPGGSVAGAVHPPADILRYLADLAAGSTAGAAPGVPEGATPETLDLTRTGERPEWLGTSVPLPLVPGGSGSTPVAATLRRTDTVHH